LEREKTNLLQETKENRDNKNKTIEEKTCDSLHNNLDVTKTTNTRIMSTNEPHMETPTNAPNETSKDKTIEDQKEASTASRNNDNMTVETEEVEPITSTSMNTNVEKTLETREATSAENNNQELQQDKTSPMIIINNNNHELQELDRTEGEYI
ncbi:10099_t:CDS:2, partial [Scutellospora calospora]